MINNAGFEKNSEASSTSNMIGIFEDFGKFEDLTMHISNKITNPSNIGHH